MSGHVEQSVTCLTADTCTFLLTADSAVPYTVVEIDHEIISTVPLIQEGLLVSCKQKYVHEVLVNR